jgi:hypothetical protein
MQTMDLEQSFSCKMLKYPTTNMKSPEFSSNISEREAKVRLDLYYYSELHLFKYKDIIA